MPAPSVVRISNYSPKDLRDQYRDVVARLKQAYGVKVRVSDWTLQVSNLGTSLVFVYRQPGKEQDELYRVAL